MQLISIIFFARRTNLPPVQLASAFNLADFSFFTRSNVKEGAVFASRLVVERVETAYSSVNHMEHHIHTVVLKSRLAVAVTADAEFPARVAFDLIQKSLELWNQKYIDADWENTNADAALSVPGLEELFTKYCNPLEADKIMKIQQQIKQTKEIMLVNIEQLLRRDELLTDLVKKSEELSFSSKAFAGKAHEMNSCCIIL